MKIPTNQIRLASYDYAEGNEDISFPEGFAQWLQTNYGFSFDFEKDYHMEDDFFIIDPKLYLLFLLKYGENK
jgi:hypothetical protein